jgi:CSLREA domain-containing protein
VLRRRVLFIRPFALFDVMKTQIRGGVSSLRGRSMNRSHGVLLALALLIAMRSSRAEGGTFMVNSTADVHDASPGNGICETAPGTGVCTLRAAVQEANAAPGSVIKLPAITIGLTLGHLVIERTMTIAGTGMHATVISGNSASRIFNIDTGEPLEFSLIDMTLRDGKPASSSGGAIFVFGDAFLSIERCLFVHNEAASGGAVFLAFGGARVEQSVFTDCHATNGDGGALALHSDVVLRDTAFYASSATERGGAIRNANSLYPTAVRLVNCTVSGNTAGSGGGIYSVEGTLALFSTTVVGNKALSSSGGGITNGAASSASFVNTILSGNQRAAERGGGAFVANDCTGTFTSGGNSIVSTVTGCTVNGGVSAVSPQLGPLQDNGGYGATHALLSGSPAIGGGHPSGCTTETGAILTADQRGVKRPIGAQCDIGAYERAPCGDVNGDGAVDVLDVFFLITHLFAGGPVPPGLANVNQDGARDVLDVFSLISHLFGGGAAPVCNGT